MPSGGCSGSWTEFYLCFIWDKIRASRPRASLCKHFPWHWFRDNWEPVLPGRYVHLIQSKLQLDWLCKLYTMKTCCTCCLRLVLLVTFTMLATSLTHTFLGTHTYWMFVSCEDLVCPLCVSKKQSFGICVKGHHEWQTQTHTGDMVSILKSPTSY